MKSHCKFYPLENDGPGITIMGQELRASTVDIVRLTRLGQLGNGPSGLSSKGFAWEADVTCHVLRETIIGMHELPEGDVTGCFVLLLQLFFQRL